MTDFKYETTNQMVLNLFQVFNVIINKNDQYEEIEFRGFLSKNKRLLAIEAEDINKELNVELKDYRQEIEDAKIVSSDGKILDMNKYSEIGLKYKDKLDKVETFMGKKTSVNLKKIKNSEVPKTLPQIFFDAIFDLIDLE